MGVSWNKNGKLVKVIDSMKYITENKQIITVVVYLNSTLITE